MSFLQRDSLGFYCDCQVAHKETSHDFYWAIILFEATTELEDSEGLWTILKSQELLPAHTATRKVCTDNRLFELWPTS